MFEHMELCAFMFMKSFIKRELYTKITLKPIYRMAFGQEVNKLT